MNAILGFSQMMEMELEEKADETFLQNVRIILSSGKHLMTLIEDVLEFSKIEDRQTVLDVTEVDVLSIAENAIKGIEQHAIENAISIQNETTHGHCPRVLADRERLQQCIQHLLSNAVKYGGTDCTVTLKCEKIPEGGVRLSVSDTGPGIPKSMQDRVFEPFDRLGNEAGTISGTGIGLNITKSLVELMGGAVSFESREGTGTTFWIDLPSSE